MTRPDFDIVIVGARCSGAPLATFLARSGAHVLVVDRDALASDQVLSTHTIHPPGFQVLDELGVTEWAHYPPSAGRLRTARTGSGSISLDEPAASGQA